MDIYKLCAHRASVVKKWYDPFASRDVSPQRHKVQEVCIFVLVCNPLFKNGIKRVFNGYL